MDEVATYLCQSCGEEISLPVEPGAGRTQEFVEDCPVCCRPQTLRVQVDRDGHVDLDVRPD